MDFAVLARWGAIAIALGSLTGLSSHAAPANETVEPKQQSGGLDIEYLDNLADCIPTDSSPPIAFPFLEGVLMTSVIQGWEADRCVVKTVAFLETDPEESAQVALCEYSIDTLAMLTDDVAYEEARTGNFSFDSDDPRDAAISAAMEQECEFSETWFDELVEEFDS